MTHYIFPGKANPDAIKEVIPYTPTILTLSQEMKRVYHLKRTDSKEDDTIAFRNDHMTLTITVRKSENTITFAYRTDKMKERAHEIMEKLK